MIKNLTVSVLTTALLLPLTTLAGEKEEALIQQVTDAYGGDAIRNLTSYIISKKMLAPSTGQSRTPQLVNLARTNLHLSVDIENGKARSDSLFASRGGDFQGATVSDGEEGWTINYRANTYGAAQNADVYAFAGGSMRTNDAILAYELYKARDKAKLVGEADYLNRPHEMVEVPFPLSPDITLYIDKESHFISKMIRTNPQLGQLDYVFSNMTEADGIKYAAQTDFFVAGVANLVSLTNRTRFNTDIPDHEFELPEGMEEEAARIDTSEMKANRLSEDVYHVGQGNGFTLFVNSPEGLIAVGGYPGLKDRLSLFRSESGNYQPLKYQIITHHHQDHLGGINEAIDLGATLVTVDDNVEPIRDFVANATDADFLRVNKRITFGEGRNRVEIYDVATIHAAHFLVTYVPSQKLIFIADHLNSPYESGVPTANLNTTTMYEALQALDLDIRKIAIAHGARVFKMKEMQASVEAYSPLVCMADRLVCE
ncbi:MAG: hypothetical protein O6945_05140 [Gammaproteobacteria bacterium]|nr:hypothetical protein [Gammaproteobacteria bacterium]